MDGNPWQVASLQDFLYLKCPECSFDTQEEEIFEDHALQNHKLSSVFFGEIFVKDENLNSEEDHKDPLKINGEIRDQSDITSSENLSLPIVPKLSNINEDLIDMKSGNGDAVIEVASSNDLTKNTNILKIFSYLNHQTQEKVVLLIWNFLVYIVLLKE